MNISSILGNQKLDDNKKDSQLSALVDNRWNSSQSVWDIIAKVSKRNAKYYECDMEDTANMPEYLSKLPRRRHKTKSNRIFTDTETVINSITANPPKPNLIPGRDTPEAKELARLQEQYFINKYNELNIRDTLRKGLRKLYKTRLIVIKPFWNAKLNDFDCKSIDPNKVRFGKRATKEDESEFAIEEVETDLQALIDLFPDKKKQILEKKGLSEAQLLTENPDITYKEAHFGDYVCFKFEDIILDKRKNPYWDWDGVLITQEEQVNLAQAGDRKQILQQAMSEQGQRKQTPDQFKAYKFNHFDHPRKPYIFATVLSDDACPIGDTSFIEQAIPLQESLDRRKQQIDDNARMVNGLWKVDSSVMTEAEAQKLRADPEGIVYGKGVKDGAVREWGQALPAFIFQDMVDSRQEIDNVMAATSAFRGEREGTETKAGRLALIEQSSLRLNELVQTVDYICSELFNWFYQLAKLNYTESHYAKTMGDQDALKVIELQRNDFEDGTEIRVIPGKTLPEDKQFKYQRAQEDVKNGVISPVDYLKEAGYNSPSEVAKNAVKFKLNPPLAVGITPEELQQIAPPQKGEPLPVAISYPDLPEDGKIQAAARAGIQLNPVGVVAKAKLDLALQEKKSQDKNLQIQTSLNVKKEQNNAKNNITK